MISSLHLLIEKKNWYLVKLCAFNCPHNCLTDGTFQSEIWNTIKIRERSGGTGFPIRMWSENFNFQGVFLL